MARTSATRHTLDVWCARADGPTPLVIFIHGGGWHGGDKSDISLKVLNFMLDHGVSVASINYRYTSIAKLPGPVYDAARAVQFLRMKAGEWKLVPRRFGAYGVSAGGCSALWLAYHDDLADPQNSDPVARQSSRLQAAVGISPQTSLDSQVVAAWLGDQVLTHPMIARAIGAKNGEEVQSRYAEWGGWLRECSPMNHVSFDDPPVMAAYPTVGVLPAPNPGAAIHHALFGAKLKERADAAGAVCMLRIEDQAPVNMLKPEEFLFQQLTAAEDPRIEARKRYREVEVERAGVKRALSKEMPPAVRDLPSFGTICSMIPACASSGIQSTSQVARGLEEVTSTISWRVGSR